MHLEKGIDTIVGLKVHKRHSDPVTDMALDMSHSHLDFTHGTIPTALASGGSLLAFASSVYNGVNIFGSASPYHDFYLLANIGAVSAKFRNYINGVTGASGNTIIAAATHSSGGRPHGWHHPWTSGMRCRAGSVGRSRQPPVRRAHGRGALATERGLPPRIPMRLPGRAASDQLGGARRPLKSPT